MNSEFFAAIEQLEKEKGIRKDYMLDRIKQAIVAALRKDDPGVEENIFVDIDEAKGKIDVYIRKNVVEEIENPAVDLLLDEAKRFSKRAKVGDIVNVPVDTKKFGRIAAQAAKQVIIQGIREAERNMVSEEFSSKEHEILTTIVNHVDPERGNVSVTITSNPDYNEAVLTAGERVPTEELHEGDKLRVYLVEVRRGGSGPQVLISRTHPGLVKKLFELEVPELSDGTVEIKSIAREAGSRTKIAVMSYDPAVEPIGACVGPKGGRVAAVVDELRGEKIDIVKYSDNPAEYVAAALAPSDVVSVEILDEGKSCRVIVPDSQLSLAIGKEGQNVRLAAKLTGYKIDIKPESEA